MNISWNWLKEYIQLDIDVEKASKILTDIGLEVEGVEKYQTIKGGLEGIVVGKVLTPLGLLLAVVVIAADTSDNTGGIAVADLARARSSRLAKVWCDAGFKRTFVQHCRDRHVAVEVVNKIHRTGFEVLPRRWVVERTWSWLMNSRRLQVDYERDPIVHEGFVWAAHSRMLLRRLTQPAPT